MISWEVFSVILSILAAITSIISSVKAIHAKHEAEIILQKVEQHVTICKHNSATVNNYGNNEGGKQIGNVGGDFYG